MEIQQQPHRDDKIYQERLDSFWHQVRSRMVDVCGLTEDDADVLVRHYNDYVEECFQEGTAALPAAKEILSFVDKDDFC